MLSSFGNIFIPVKQLAPRFRTMEWHPGARRAGSLFLGLPRLWRLANIHPLMTAQGPSLSLL